MNGSVVLQILTAIPWFGWIAIVAVICGCITTVSRQVIVHRERMAMLQRGMNPDAPGPAKAYDREL